MNVTMNLFHTSLEIDGHTVASASKTPKGWYWFSNVGRVGKRLDFDSKDAALKAAARSLGLKINEVIE